MATATAGNRVVSPWNPANAVTASRFLTLPPLYWAVAHGEQQLSTLFILVCGLLDKLDGLAARVFNCRSQFGELFDAIADATCYGFALVLVAAFGWAPWIPVIAIIAMGAANTVMRVLYGKRLGRGRPAPATARRRTAVVLASCAISAARRGRATVSAETPI